MHDHPLCKHTSGDGSLWDAGLVGKLACLLVLPFLVVFILVHIAAYRCWRGCQEMILRDERARSLRRTTPAADGPGLESETVGGAVGLAGDD